MYSCILVFYKHLVYDMSQQTGLLLRRQSKGQKPDLDLYAYRCMTTALVFVGAKLSRTNVMGESV